MEEWVFAPLEKVGRRCLRNRFGTRIPRLLALAKVTFLFIKLITRFRCHCGIWKHRFVRDASVESSRSPYHDPRMAISSPPLIS